MAATIQRSYDLRVTGAETVVAALRRVGQEADSSLPGVATAAGKASRGLDDFSAAAGRASQAATKSARDFETAGNGISKNFRGALGNAGFQVQDFIVQIEGGTSAFRAFSQQAPQFLSAFGPVGILLGTVVTVGSLAASAIFGLGEKTSETARLTDIAKASHEAFQQTLGATASSVEDLTRKYAGLTAELRKFEQERIQSALLEADRTAQAAKRAANEQATALEEQFGRTDLQFADQGLVPRQYPPEVQAQIEANRRLFEANDALKTNGNVVDYATTASGVLRDLINRSRTQGIPDQDVKALDDSRQKLIDFGEKSKQAAEDMAKLNAQLALLEGRATAADKALLGNGKGGGAANKVQDLIDQAKRLVAAGNDARKAFVAQGLERLPEGTSAEDRAAYEAQLNQLYDLKVAREGATKAASEQAAADRKAASDAEHDAGILARLSQEIETATNKRQRYIDTQLRSLSASASPALRNQVAAAAGERFDRDQAEEQRKKAETAAKQQAESVDRFLQQVSPSTEKVSLQIAKLNTLYEQGAQKTDGTRISTEEYTRALDELERKMKDAHKAELERRRDAGAGVERALADYGDEATDMAKATETATTTVLTGLEDAFVQFAQTGKLTFKDLATSILADLERIAVRAAITGPLAKAAGSFFDGLLPSTAAAARPTVIVQGSPQTTTLGSLYSVNVQHDGSMATTRLVDRRLFAMAPRFHDGLRADEYPAILQKGESVIPKGRAADAGGTKVTFINNTGVPMEEESRKQSGDNRSLEIVLKRQQIANIESGAYDGAMKRRYGVMPNRFA